MHDDTMLNKPQKFERAAFFSILYTLLLWTISNKSTLIVRSKCLLRHSFQTFFHINCIWWLKAFRVLVFYVFQKYFETINAFWGKPKQFRILESEQTAKAKLSFTLPHGLVYISEWFSRSILFLNAFDKVLRRTDFCNNWLK